MVDPKRSALNFARLIAIGARGRYGLFEAFDYTRSRLPEGSRFAVVRAFMAHHQGMSVVAIANVLFDGRMRERFHAEPRIQATELLLQERAPRDVSVAHPRAEEVSTAARINEGQLPQVRRLRHSQSCSCRPSMSPRCVRCWRRGDGARLPSLKSGLRITKSLKARHWASPRRKRIEPVSWAADAAFTHPAP